MMHTTIIYVPSNPGKLLGQEVDELRIALQGERAALSVLRSQQLNEADGETDAMNSSTEPESSFLILFVCLVLACHLVLWAYFGL